MKKELTFEQLALISQGHAAFQLLWAGVNLRVFDFLSEKPGSSFEEIQAAIDLEEQPAKILVVGLTSLLLIQKDGDSFRNSEVVEKLMVRSSPENMVDVLGWQNHISYPGLFYFVDSLKANKNLGLQHFSGDEDNLYARISHSPELEKVFQDAMASLSRSANKILSTDVPFDEVKHLVDAGGGAAENAIALAKANPHLRITIFDSPTVCERAKENIVGAGFESRIDTHPGNFFERDFPEGIDAILFAHMMPIWTPERDTLLLRRAYDALPEGGRVIIFSMMADDDEAGPVSVTLGSPYFLSIATGQGRMYAWKDYEKFLSDAGFKQTLRMELPKQHGVLVGIK